MTWRVTASLDAEADLSEAIDWYEDRQPGLGERLLEDVRRVRRRLETNPFQFPVVYRDARRGLMRDFPYALIFRVSDTEVRILACFHTSRAPRRWQARVRRSH